MTENLLVTERMELQNKIAELQKRGGSALTTRYPKKLKKEVVNFVESCILEGRLDSAKISKILGISKQTINTWRRQYGTTTAKEKTIMTKTKNTVSKFRAALEMSKDDVKKARIDRTHEDTLLKGQRLIEDKERELKDLKLDRDDLLGPENVNPDTLLEKWAKKTERIEVLEKRIDFLKKAYTELFEG